MERTSPLDLDIIFWFPGEPLIYPANSDHFFHTDLKLLYNFPIHESIWYYYGIKHLNHNPLQG